MIRTILLTMAVMLCMCGLARAAEPNVVTNDALTPTTPGFAVWGQIDNSLERILGLRVGVVTDFAVEVGGTALWQQGEDWDETPEYYGMYVAYWIDEIGLVDDSDGYSGIEDLLHMLIARPYFVLEGLYADVEDKIVLGIGAGTAFYAKQDIKQVAGLTIEYMTIEGYEQKLRAGLRLKF